MPPISDDIPIGTGFVVNIHIEDVPFKYVVTANHVVMGSRKYGKLFIRLNTTDGDTFPWYPPIDQWLRDEVNDVAAILMYSTELPRNLYLRFLPFNLFATDEYLKEHEVGTGDTIFTVGCQFKTPGKRHNEPVARFGRIARMPGEKMILSMPDLAEPIETTGYLLNCSIPSVTSGSPVFYYTEENHKIDQLRLLGLLWGILPDPEFYEKGEQEEKDRKLGFIPDAALSVAIPADAIKKLIIETGDAVEKRKEIVARKYNIPIGIPLSYKGDENV